MKKTELLMSVSPRYGWEYSGDEAAYGGQNDRLITSPGFQFLLFRFSNTAASPDLLHNHKGAILCFRQSFDRL